MLDEDIYMFIVKKGGKILHKIRRYKWYDKKYIEMFNVSESDIEVINEITKTCKRIFSIAKNKSNIRTKLIIHYYLSSDEDVVEIIDYKKFKVIISYSNEILKMFTIYIEYYDIEYYDIISLKYVSEVLKNEYINILSMR